MVDGSFFESGPFQELSPGSRLLSLALLQIADDEGLILWNEAFVRAYAFPSDPVAPVRNMISELESVDFLTVIERDRQDYLWIPDLIEVD